MNMPLLDGEGHVLATVGNTVGYAVGLITPPASELCDNFLRNDDLFFTWYIYTAPNAKRVSDMQSPEAVEIQVAFGKDTISGNPPVTVAPGIDLGKGDGEIHEAFPLSSPQAKQYIQTKYGEEGLERLAAVLRTGNAF